MRTLNRNKQTIYYANYQSETEVVDENGFYTGEKDVTYSTPTEAKVNVSPARGEASIELFGTDLNYTNTIVTDRDFGWDENTVMWIGVVPSMASISNPYNYRVVSVARSINVFAYAIKKVDVSESST